MTPPAGNATQVWHCHSRAAPPTTTTYGENCRHSSPPNSCTQIGRRRWPPPRGSSIRRPPKVRTACWTREWSVCIFVKILALSSASKFSTRKLRSHNPSFCFSPGTSRTPEPPPKDASADLLARFLAIFGPSETHLKFCFEKISKKVRKSSILASQNPPQTLPKSTFWATFVQNVDFVKIVLSLRRRAHFRAWEPPQNPPKRGLNGWKIDSKNDAFFDSIF